MNQVRKASKKQERFRKLWRSYRNSLDTTVKGGFPVTIWYNIGGAEPDVGIMSDYIDDWCLTTQDGVNCDWLKLTEKQEQALLDEIYELDLGRNDDYDYDYDDF